jgi:hypothetical protein
MGIRFDITYAVKELSRVLQEPTQIASEILERTLDYVTQTKEAFLFLVYNHDTMIKYTLPATRKITHAQQNIYDTQDYIHKDDISHHNDKPTTQTYKFQGPNMTTTCYTDIDLAEQHETRQSTSGYLLYLNGGLVHWHGRTERLIIKFTAAGEYIALSRGHAACQFMTTTLQFYGSQVTTAYLFIDNQAAEHIATKPTMNEHSRSIDIRHHAVRQDYLEGKVQIRGVKTTENPSDILTKFLQAPTHKKHTSPLNINFRETSSDTLPTHTLTPSKTTYTQNGNYISNPSTTNPHTRQHKYRRTSPSLSTRRPHPLSGDINVRATRRLRYARARVCLHQPDIDMNRRPHSLPSSYQKGRLKRNNKNIRRHATLTPTTHRHQAINRQQPYMRAPQHIPPQTHHAPKDTRNNMVRHTNRQHCKPPPRHLHQPLQHHKVRTMSVDHSLLENHQKQHTTQTRTTRVRTNATFSKQEQQRVEKWLRTFITPPLPAATSTKPSHPFAFKQTHQPTASTTNKLCK